jgi:Fe-S-cluster-containing hydrogenase component 2
MEAIRSKAVVYHPDVCSACGICEMVCSLWHEGRVGPALARVNILRDAFSGNHRHWICQQCDDPPCYDACPSKDKAFCIDRVTGVTYINEDECDGCGLCIEACLFDPPRIKFHTSKRIAFKCNLCKGREEGPLCVEYCPFQALTFSKNE